MKETYRTAQKLQELDTTGELAKELRVTPQTINTWRRKKIISPKICVGRIIRYDRAEVMEQLAGWRL